MELNDQTIQHFVSLLSTDNVSSWESTFQSLGDVARESQGRHLLSTHLESEILQPTFQILSSLLQSTPLTQNTLLSKILRFLTNASYEMADSAVSISKSPIAVNSESNSNIFDALSVVFSQIDEQNQSWLEIRRNAFALITNLAHEDDSIRQKILQNQAILSILLQTIESLNYEDDSLMTLHHAARCLVNITKYSDAGLEIIKLRKLYVLIDLATKCTDSDIQIFGVECLQSVCIKEEICKEVLKTEAISLLTKELLNSWSQFENEEPDEEEESTYQTFISEVLVLLNVLLKIGKEEAAHQLQTQTMSSLWRILSSKKEASQIKDSILVLFSELANFDFTHSTLVHSLSGFMDWLLQAMEWKLSDEDTVSNYSAYKNPDATIRFGIRILGSIALQDEYLHILMTEKVLQKVLIPLIRFEKDVMVQRNACICVGNMARSEQHCASIVKAGVVPILIEILKQEAPKTDFNEEPAPDFVTRLNIGDVNLKINVAFVLNNLLKSKQRAEIVKQVPSIAQVLIDLLEEEKPDALQTYGVESIANLCQLYYDDSNCKIGENFVKDLCAKRMYQLLEKGKHKATVSVYVLKALYLIYEACESKQEWISLWIQHQTVEVMQQTVGLVEQSLPLLENQIQTVEQEERKQKLKAQHEIMQKTVTLVQQQLLKN